MLKTNTLSFLYPIYMSARIVQLVVISWASREGAIQMQPPRLVVSVCFHLIPVILFVNVLVVTYGVVRKWNNKWILLIVLDLVVSLMLLASAVPLLS